MANSPLNLKQRLQRIFLRTILILISAVALTFVIDFVIFRVRVAANWNPYGAVTVDRYFAVHEKSGKTEFMFQPPQTQTCVNALFPHEGLSPCWYLSRHPEQRTDV
jgi:hypothetical protein